MFAFLRESHLNGRRVAEDRRLDGMRTGGHQPLGNSACLFAIIFLAVFIFVSLDIRFHAKVLRNSFSSSGGGFKLREKLLVLCLIIALLRGLLRWKLL